MRVPSGEIDGFANCGSAKNDSISINGGRLSVGRSFMVTLHSARLRHDSAPERTPCRWGTLKVTLPVGRYYPGSAGSRRQDRYRT
ncbi:hypothetical protein GCM10011588_00290 [Nocardia jinanensis]|uniref:Uncharacterized protein n=1 Tax=Nocardia jinanensis TaxID=382504 RepID=A0A917R4A0_9NOCA|nr:hypothetical protein GCM10011588_00290 [Nocardia jinanensis]